MKSILLSVKPEWLVKILNGEKTIEVRKKFPKDYVGWVYMYCSKNKSKGYLVKLYDHSTDDTLGYSTPYYKFEKIKDEIMPMPLNGKVVARFWCDKVEEIHDISIMLSYHHYIGDFCNEDEICKGSCLHWKDLGNYLEGKNGFAIHISKLEIFDRPKELSEFWNCGKQVRKGVFQYSIIHKAPQNYCYIEVEENC